MPAERILLCDKCGAQNRIPGERSADKAWCGRCSELLIASASSPVRVSGSLIAILMVAVATVGLVGYLVFTSRSHVEIGAGRQGYAAETFTAPAVAIETGVVRFRPGRQRIAPFAIQTPVGNDFFVKMINLADLGEEIAIYIEGGRFFETEMPLGTYELRYAAGEVWYGERHRFGPKTIYYKADETFVFRIDGNSVAGYTVELILQVDGNLSTTQIDASKF